MNLRRELGNPVFIDSCLGCDRLSTGDEVRRATEFSFQAAFELGLTSDRTFAVESWRMDVLLEKLAWAAFCNDTPNRKNN
jgi:hypothetical protein